MDRFRVAATLTFVTAGGLGLVSAAKPPKPPASVAATAVFRCLTDQGLQGPDCEEAADGTVTSEDRARDDGNVYATGIIGSSGGFDLRLVPASGRQFTLLFGATIAPRGCAAVGNCNPGDPNVPDDEEEQLGGDFGTADQQVLTLTDFQMSAKPLVDGIWADLPGGLFAMSCDEVPYPALVHFTFWLPAANGHWGLNFNPRAYQPSTAATLKRIDAMTWTLETVRHTNQSVLSQAELISFVHSGIRRHNGPSREGSFVMPFKVTITATSGTPACPL